MKQALVFLSVSFLLIGNAYAGNVDTYGIGAKATALGGAFAAHADNVFAIHYNPAGLMQLKGASVAAGITAIDPVLTARNYTVEANPGLGTGQQGPANIADDGPMLFDPHAGFAVPVAGKFVIGAALYSPYGLKLEWSKDPGRNPGAYNSYESWYARTVATPTVAYQVSDKLSVGLGVALGQTSSGAKYKLSQANANMLAYGIGQQMTMMGLPPAQIAAAMGAAQSLANGDIEADLKDDFNYSVNLGVMYRPVEALTFGLTYRSKASTSLEGDVEYKGSGAQMQALSALAPLGIQSSATGTVNDIDAPDQLQLGVRYMLTEKVSYEVDVVWTNWSAVEHETTYFDALFLGQSSAENARFWRDTTQLRMGLEWRAHDLLSLRCGYFYDPSPVPDNTFDTLWADADKKTYSVGAGLHLKNWTVDGAVQYTVTEMDRVLGGESETLNESYGGSPVELSAGGCIWGFGLTVGYHF
ncbi:MAG: OmpP1/FadL family transporter [Thermodesulfobacteriota bacterium]